MPTQRTGPMEKVNRCRQHRVFQSMNSSVRRFSASRLCFPVNSMLWSQILVVPTTFSVRKRGEKNEHGITSLFLGSQLPSTRPHHRPAATIPLKLNLTHILSMPRVFTPQQIPSSFDNAVPSILPKSSPRLLVMYKKNRTRGELHF